MTETDQTLIAVDEFLASADERNGRWKLELGILIAMALLRLAHVETKAAAWAALGA